MGGGKGGGGGSGDTQTTIRYAPYIEEKHQDYLNEVVTRRDAIIDDSPFTGYTDIVVDDAFFGAGYLLTSFPSLYDMFGKFMAGLDIEVLWNQAYEDTVNGTVVEEMVSVHSDLLEDDVQTTSLPALQTGMRDMNAVVGSSFVIAKGLIEDSRVKQVNKFAADAKFRMIPIAQDRWNIHLNWNKLVVVTYAELLKFYYSAKTDVNEANYAMAVKDRLWPFTVLDFERAALGALQGATNQKTDVAGASTTSRVLAGALSGGAMGAMIGGQIAATETVVAGGAEMSLVTGSYAGWGAGIGAVLGAAAAYTY